MLICMSNSYNFEMYWYFVGSVDIITIINLYCMRRNSKLSIKMWIYTNVQYSQLLLLWLEHEKCCSCKSLYKAKVRRKQKMKRGTRLAVYMCCACMHARACVMPKQTFCVQFNAIYFVSALFFIGLSWNLLAHTVRNSHLRKYEFM